MGMFTEPVSRFIRRAAAIGAMVVAASGSATAQPITFTFTGTGAGSIAGQAFRLTPFTVTIGTDISAITTYPGSPGTLAYLGLGGTIDLGAFGVATFSDPLYVFNNVGASILGFGTPTNFDLIDLIDASFPTYDLKSSFGPVVNFGTYFNSQFANVSTSLGSLTLTTIDDRTFQAAVGTTTTPEPAAIVLVATGLVALGAVRRRRMRA